MTKHTETSKSLGDYAQEAVKLVAAFNLSEDAITKQHDLSELEEHVLAFLGAIKKEYDAVADQHNQEVIVELEQVAKSFNFNNLDDMLAKIGKAPSALTMTGNKASGKAKRAARGKNQPQVYRYLLKDEHANKTDLKAGYIRLPDEHKNSGLYRAADEKEIAQMKQSQAEWNKQHPNK